MQVKFIGYLLIVFFLLIYPMYIGRFLCLKLKKEYCENICFAYVLGFTLVLASFQLICFPLAIFNFSFSAVVILFSFVSLVLFIISVNQVRLKKLFTFESNNNFKDLGTKILTIILLSIILFQIGTLVLKAVYALSGDDTSYLAISDSAVKHNILFRFNPYTGEYWGIGVDKKRITTTYHIFISYLSQISGVHVLEIAHTILPIFLIPLAYCAASLFTYMVFGDDLKKQLVFMILWSLLIMWGAYSIYTVSFRILVAPWQGKALMASIFLPLLLYFSIQIFVNGWNCLESFILIVICIAGQSTSLMVNGLFVFTVFAVFLCTLKKKSLIKNLMLSSIFTVLCGLNIGFYLLFNHFINILGLE